MSQKLRVPTASVKEKLLKKEPDPFSVSAHGTGAPLPLPLPLPFGYLHAAPPAGAFPTPAVSPPTPEAQAMAEDRNQQPDPQSAPLAPLLTAEVLRHAASAREPKAKGEDGVSPFWRLFGATILSIVALAAVTLYQQLAGGLSEVRHELGQLTRKEEFVASRSKVWEKFFEIQKNTEHGDV